ncbi:MFS transporter [Nonomuraea muscovyensis]|uniref:EmrB/QacA subfamily drug resistance transporter n=1 Tax=Nonomuraea muscovyensis TaxID=1124761 RepID=A0A7X0EWY5_9ACTN|nr:MFS transporter [Nonomuraea muscovyensis]MBB6344809.1 EmrB/QacA subfamily drug resistance transporter [Nonomuraea muscovyensis]
MKSNDVRDDSNAVRDPRRWWILVVLCLSLLVLVVDNTVLNLAIPKLISDLGASPGEIQWILDAYVLAFAGLLLTAGSLSDRYGRRRFLIIGLVFFGGASLLAVLASEPWELIGARALMGVGGAILMPSTLSILMTVFDEGERRKAMAAWSAVAMVGVIAGPTLGGFLLDNYWWGSVFLLNIPIAAVAVLAAVTLMPETRSAGRKIDPVGVVLSIIGLTSAVYVIIEREWNVAGIAVAVVALGAFVVWERRSPHAMLPLELFRNRNFSGASFSILLMSFGAGAVMLMLTQYLQFVLGYGPMRAGLALLPYAVAAALFNGVGAALGQKVSNRILVAAGLLVMAAGFAVMATTTGYPLLLTGLLVMGVGGGLAGPAAYASLMGAIPMEHAGVGSALNDTVQQVGMAMSIAILGSVLAGVFTASMPADVPEAARASIGDAFRLGVVEPAKAAFTDAMHLGAWVGAGFCVAAAMLALAVLRPPAPVAAPEPARV